MKITFTESSPRGQQWSVEIDGRTVAGVSRKDVAALLRGEGHSINESENILARAKMQS